MDPATARKQSQNNGLASIAAVIDSSSSMENHPNRNRLMISRSLYPPKTTSFGSGMFFNGRFQEQQPHFLDACFLCKKPLGCNRDIFMYRGDTPFCSEECRAEQIEMDEAKEKKRSFSASIKAMRKKEESEKSSNNSSPNYPLRSGAVAAA